MVKQEQMKILAEILSPNICMVCQQPCIELSEFPSMCGRCLQTLPWRLDRSIIAIQELKQPNPDFYRDDRPAAVYAACDYEGRLRRCLISLKFYGQTGMARPLAALLARSIRSLRIDPDAVAAVPLHAARLRERGYNQAECFARALSEKTGIRMAKGLVRRVKNTSPLKTLGYVERRNCLEGAFQVADSIVQYDQILIVDDIYTTGSTAESIGHEIAKKCPGRVYVLCICIGQGS